MRANARVLIRQWTCEEVLGTQIHCCNCLDRYRSYLLLNIFQKIHFIVTSDLQNQILNNFIKMIRGVRQNKKQAQLLPRSRSKSPTNLKINQKSNQKLPKSPIQQKNSKTKKINRSRSKSPQRSINNKNPNKDNNKKELKKSKSQKKLNKSLSSSKLQAKKKIPTISKVQKNKKSISQVNKNNVNSSLLMKSARINSKQQTPKIIKQRIESTLKQKSKSIILNEQPPTTIKNEQKQMGLIFVRPQSDRPLFKPIQINDDVFDKYHDMISNDNDSNYVTNALPQLLSLKRQNDTAGRDFVSGKIARLSGVFDSLTVDKIITWVKKIPNYYTGQSGKNLITLRIILQTKFKVQVDVGWILYSVDGDKVTIFRIYLSKIYRKMNYLGFIYIEAFKYLMAKHTGCDRWSIFVLQKNVNVHKFFKYLGFRIEKIATESKNKNVDYFQQFTIKRKELNTVTASMK